MRYIRRIFLGSREYGLRDLCMLFSGIKEYCSHNDMLITLGINAWESDFLNNSYTKHYDSAQGKFWNYFIL